MRGVLFFAAVGMLGVASYFVSTVHPLQLNEDKALAIYVEGRTQTVIKEVPFWVKVKNPENAPVFWSTPSGVTCVEKPEGMHVSSCPNGVHKFFAKVLRADWENKKYLPPLFLEIEVVVQVGDDPNPDPPKPNPPVPPESGKVWIIVIEETKDASASRGVLMTEKSLSDYVKSKGHTVIVADKDIVDKSGETPKSLHPYIVYAKAEGLPMAFFVNESGDVLYKGSVPETPAKFLDLLKKVGA